MVHLSTHAALFRIGSGDNKKPSRRERNLALSASFDQFPDPIYSIKDGRFYVKPEDSCSIAPRVRCASHDRVFFCIQSTENENVRIFFWSFSLVCAMIVMADPPLTGGFRQSP